MYAVSCASIYAYLIKERWENILIHNDAFGDTLIKRENSKYFL
jgi:hypothetical protein